MVRIVQSLRASDGKLKALVEDQGRKFFDQNPLERFLVAPFEDGAMRPALQLANALARKSDTLVVVGVGGSSLGAQVFAEWFQGRKGIASHRKVYFLDNLDPLQFERIWSCLVPQETAFLFVSKSGSSLETLATCDLIVQKMGSHLKVDAVGVITEPGPNILRAWAQDRKFQIVDWDPLVGGRFSVLTPTGMVVASFLGAAGDEILNGARQSFNTQRSEVVEFVAQVLLSWRRSEWVTQFWLYSSAMKAYGAWLEQLWSESLAKAVTLSGRAGPPVSTPMICIGSSHQHSLLQQLMEGQRDKLAVFLRCAGIEAMGEKIETSAFSKDAYWVRQSFGSILKAQAQGTAAALRSQGISVMELELSGIDEFSAGAGLMFWQLVVAVLGRTLDIDPFNQPGVELGKKISKEILSKPLQSEPL